MAKSTPNVRSVSGLSFAGEPMRSLSPSRVTKPQCSVSAYTLVAVIPTVPRPDPGTYAVNEFPSAVACAASAAVTPKYFWLYLLSCQLSCAPTETCHRGFGAIAKEAATSASVPGRDPN